MLALDLAIGLGTARRQAGEPGYREALVDAARRALALEDTDRLVAAILAGDRGFFSVAGVDREVVGVIEAALERLPADHPDRAVVLGILCQELTLGSPLDRRLTIADEAMALVRAHGDDATVVRVLNLVSVPLRVPSLLDQSLAWSAEALERADRVGDPVLLFWAADRRVTVTGCSGDTEEMDRCLELSGELADRLGQPILLWVWNFQMACRALIAGDYDRAEQLLGISLEYGRRTDGFNVDVYSISTLGGIARQRGLGAQFIPALEEVVATVTAEASELEGVNFTVYQASLAECYAELGQIDDARRVLDELAVSGFDFPMDFLWLYHLPATAKAAIVVGDPGYAGQVLDLMAPFPDHHGYLDTDSHGPFSRFLGGLETVLGRFDEAEAHLDHSAGYAARVGAPYFAAETDLYRGRLYAARRGPGDVDRARAGFAEALGAAAERGYGAIERQAAAGLAELD